MGKGSPPCDRVVGFVVGYLNTKCCDTLSEGDIFLQHDAVEGDGVVENESQRRGETAVGDGPVGMVMGVEYLRRRICGATAVGGRDRCFGGKVVVEDAVEGGTEFH